MPGPSCGLGESMPPAGRGNRRQAKPAAEPQQSPDRQYRRLYRHRQADRPRKNNAPIAPRSGPCQPQESDSECPTFAKLPPRPSWVPASRKYHKSLGKSCKAPHAFSRRKPENLARQVPPGWLAHARLQQFFPVTSPDKNNRAPTLPAYVTHGRTPGFSAGAQPATPGRCHRRSKPPPLNATSTPRYQQASDATVRKQGTLLWQAEWLAQIAPPTQGGLARHAYGQACAPARGPPPRARY